MAEIKLRPAVGGSVHWGVWLAVLVALAVGIWLIIH